MMKTYPKFLNNSLEGKDLFEGQSHDKVAQVIKDSILNNSLENHVVGIEGEWGSGKSNAIEILKKKFVDDKKKPFFFTFDAWGHQEDLTRRSFLEELIFELLDKDILINKGDRWKEIEASLLARKSTKHINKFPAIKKYWIFITLALFSFTFFSIIYDDFFFEKDNVTFIDFNFGLIEVFLIKYFVPIILFYFGIKDLQKEYKKLKNPENIGLEDGQIVTRWKKIEYLAYWFDGKNITSKEVENIIDKEPSVKQFKRYFNKIVEDLNPDKVDQLILVFDNMDRLSTNQKLMSLWSSIHTFFTECYYNNIWILIPFDRIQLAKFFDSNDSNNGHVLAEEFINKTFSTSFRFSPPVVSDWKSFFEVKIKDAFGKDYFKDKTTESEKYFIETIFDYSFPSIINPRQIIAYINSIVSLSKQWGNQIPLRYLALFTIKRNDIINEPLESISKASYLGNLRSLFLEDVNLEKYMASLVFNVDLDKANEVLLKRQMEQIFINKDIKRLKEITEHSAFRSYFDKVFKEFTVSNVGILDNIGEILLQAKTEFSGTIYHSFWRRINNELYNEVFNKGHFSKDFQEIHKLSLSNSKNPKGTPKKIIKSLIANTKEEDLSSSKRVSFDYYEFVKKIEAFLLEKSIDINLFEVLPYSVIEVKDYINIVEIELEKFNNYKIITVEKELNQYIENNDYGLTYLEENPKKFLIQQLVEVLGHDKFKTLRKKIVDNQKTVEYSATDEIRELVITQRLVTKPTDKPISNRLSFETVRDHYSNYYDDIEDDSFTDIICLLISYQKDKSYESAEFLEILDSEENNYNVKDFAQIIEYYTTYGDLIQLIIGLDKSYALLNGIVNDLTINSYGTSTLNISWAFSNISKIVEKIFKDDKDIFFKKFDGWSSAFNKYVNSKNLFEVVEESFFKEISNESKQRFKSIKLILDLAMDKFESYSSAEWLNLFDSESKGESIFKHLYWQNQIPKKITKSNEFMVAFEGHMNNIISKKVEDYDTPFWSDFIATERINVNSLKRIFSNILDSLLHHNHNITKNELLFFNNGLIKYATNLVSEAPDVQRKILIPFMTDDKVVENFIIPNKEKIVEIINSSDEFLHDIKLIIKSKLEKESVLGFDCFKLISEQTKIHSLIKADMENEEESKNEESDD